MSSTSLTTRSFSWRTTLLVVVAGLLSFGLAFVSSRWLTDSHSEIVEVSPRPGGGDGASVVRKLVSPPPQVSSVHLPSGSAETATTYTPALRMDATAAHNPFGRLNLRAQAELDQEASGSQREPAVPPPPRPARSPMPLALPPPAPVAAVAQPPNPAASTLGQASAKAPSAPPVPFVAVGGIQGRMIAGGTPVAFLRIRDEVFAVRDGDRIGSEYQIEEVLPDRVTLIFLPLMERQSIQLSR